MASMRGGSGWHARRHTYQCLVYVFVVMVAQEMWREKEEGRKEEAMVFGCISMTE